RSSDLKRVHERHDESRDLVPLLSRVDPAGLLARREHHRPGDRPAGCATARTGGPVSAVDLTALQRPNDRLWRRRAVNRGMEVLAWLAAAIAVAILGVVVWSVAKRGASELNLNLFTKTPVSFAIGNQAQGLAN